MPTTLSNPRDLLVQLLGEALYVERRLTGGVLQDLIDAVADEDLAATLRSHLEQTQTQVARCESAFQALAVAPTSNRSRAFEAGVAEHQERAESFASWRLADSFHTHAGLVTEHLEIELYTAILALGDACGYDDALEPLRDSLAEEQEARDALEQQLCQLVEGAGLADPS